MGVYANTVSMLQFNVEGELPAGDRFDWFSSSLAARAFRSIEETTDEASEGWVRTDSVDNSDFDVPAAFMRDHFLFFTYRRDQRKVSAAVMKSHVARAETEYLKTRPELRRPPKRVREEIKERVKLGLLAKTIPTPSTVDAVWDINTGILTLFSASVKASDRFDDLFKKTFDNLRLVMIHPYARGLAVLKDSGIGEQLLVDANQATSDAVMTLIKSNRWIGEDLLVWLLCNGLTGRSDHKVVTSGSAERGTAFAAWVDDRILFEGGGEGGPQKVVVSGSQDKYAEARAALQIGKAISGATIYIEMNENQWKFRLGAEMFSFSSFRCPAVRIEREGVEDLSEREAVFYERLHLLGQGLQLFDSLLAAYLQERTGPAWGDWQKTLTEWLSGDID
jgi:hypothetical protein